MHVLPCAVLQYSLYPEAMVPQMVAEVLQAVLLPLLPLQGPSCDAASGHCFCRNSSLTAQASPRPICLPACLSHALWSPSLHLDRRSAAL